MEFFQENIENIYGGKCITDTLNENWTQYIRLMAITYADADFVVGLL